MLITCPSCAHAYDLPDDRIGQVGRKVRCASCRESWFVASPGEMTDPDRRPPLQSERDQIDAEIVARPLPPPVLGGDGTGSGRRKARGGRKGRTGATKGGASRLRALGRVAALAAICGAVPGLLAFREKVVTVAPGTASLFRTIGLPVNVVGLSFAGVRSTVTQENDVPVLEVSGDIVNDGRAARTVPWLHISIEGEGGEALYSWSAKAAEGELGVGQTAPFKIRLTAPPPAARKVEVTFRERRGSRAGAATH